MNKHNAAQEQGDDRHLSTKGENRNVRTRWEVNLPLASVSVLVTALAIALLSYLYIRESDQLAISILSKANASEDSADWEGQVKWLARYLQLTPNDQQSVVKIAIAANNAVKNAPANRYDRVERARTRLNEAIAVANQAELPLAKKEELERLLILRLSQYEDRYIPEIISKIIALNPSQSDPLMLRIYAIAAQGYTQARDNRKESESQPSSPDMNPWESLLEKPPAYILWTAWKAAPDDLDVTSALLKQIRELSGTDDAEETHDNMDVKAVLESIVTNLSARQDNGRAQWLLYEHESSVSPELASQRLANQLDSSLSRLRLAKQESDTDSPRPSADSPDDSPAIPVLPEAGPNPEIGPAWDYALVLSALLDAIRNNPPLESPERKATLLQLQELCDLSSLDVAPLAINSAHEAYGELLVANKEFDKAFQAYDKGIERLGSESSQLQIAKISLLLNLSSLTEAETAITQLENLQRERTALLTGTSEMLTQDQRVRYRADLDQTTWYLLLFRGLAALNNNRIDEAITRLQLALESQITIPNTQRVVVAAGLGTAYFNKRLWDLAAAAYEKAAEYATDRDRYRVMAADAWSRCGNTERETQLRNAVEFKSLPLSIASLKSSINSELSKPEKARDFSILLNRAEVLRQQISSLEESDDNKNTLLSELELLALSIPDREDGQERASSSERLLNLTKQFPDNVQILTVAALMTAIAKDGEACQQVLLRLEEILGSDDFQYVATTARTSAIQGELDTALNLLDLYWKEHPAYAAQTLALAANLAKGHGNHEQAYNLLKSIPNDQHTVESLFELFSVALIIAQQNQETSADSLEVPTPWVQRLKEIEGDNGTWWRLAEATLSLAKAQALELTNPDRTALLAHAATLQRETHSRRPRWSLNSSLAGWIDALRGNAPNAIISLRRGIASGDRRPSTLLLLVSQLNTANRLNEAEAELSRLDRFGTNNSVSNSLAIAIAERKGDFERSMALARDTASNNPRDTSSWLLLAQTAMMAAKATDEKKAKDILLAESKRALDQALVTSNNSNLATYQLRIQFQASFFDNQGVRKELERTLESNVQEPSKSLFVGQAYLQLKDPEAALKVLERLQTISPSSPDSYVGLAEYYRYMRNDEENVRMLEEAFKRGPKRFDIRSRLALALALRQGGQVPWKRIKQLIGDGGQATGTNELLHALILINRGDATQRQEAAAILTKIRQGSDVKRDDATRMLAGLETQDWLSAIQSESPQKAARALAKAQNLYTELTRRPNPTAMDLYRYGDLLLRANQTNELNTVADKLDRIAAGSALSLDLRLRLAKQNGDVDEASRLAEQWAEQAINSGALLKSSVWGSVGQALTRLGFHDEALEWLAKIYETDPSRFREYVVGLARSQRYLRATEICKTEYERSNNPEAVALMADVTILAGTTTEFPAENENLYRETTRQHAAVPGLVEAIATLRLSQQRYDDAVKLYEQALALAPKNARILNNLAMALSEIPGREREALPKIQLAVDEFGRSPELLDTQGLVYLRNNLVSEAVKVLQDATTNSNDPRYRFHLIMALLQSGDRKKAISQWAQLDLRQLRQMPLTPGELKDLNTIEKEFGKQT